VFYGEPVKGSREEWLYRLKDWNKHTRARTRFIKVKGDHHTLLDPDHVASLHGALKAELQRTLP
jgi:thioesterase domain-containing protein